MHAWGDEWFEGHGAELNEAVLYLGTTLRKWRIPVRDYKEKWGTARVYCSLGWGCLHDMTHPGHCFRRYKWDWVWRLSCKSQYAWWWWPIMAASSAIHKRIYRKVYGNAVRRWPHMAAEILSMADFRELLEGLVPPETCSHSEVWHSMDGHGRETQTCGVCGKDLMRSESEDVSEDV